MAIIFQTPEFSVSPQTSEGAETWRPRSQAIGIVTPLVSPLPLQSMANILRWRDGRKFSRRVQVVSFVGRYLYSRHAEEAYRLCDQGVAVPYIESKDRQITQIVLMLPAGKPKGPPHPASPRDYGTKPMIARKKVGDLNAWEGKFVFEFKPIHDNDRWVYLLSISTTIRAQGTFLEEQEARRAAFLKKTISFQLKLAEDAPLEPLV